MSVPDFSINADDVAKDLAGGGQPSDAQSLEAAQTSDRLLDGRIAAGQSVIVETVLSSGKHKARVLRAQSAGFKFVLVYVAVRIPELNVARVALRFAKGGHDVPQERIRARRERSHELFGWFARMADDVYVFDNSSAVPSTAAVKQTSGWRLPNLDLLPPDLAATIRSIAAGQIPPPQE